MRNILANPRSATLIGFSLFLPLFLMNVMAGLDLEAFDAFFQNVFTINGYQTNPLGSFVMIVAVLLLPAGCIVALRPVLRKEADGKRRLYIANLILAAVIFGFLVIFVGGAIDTIYRCDVLRIPNCD